MSRDAIKVDIMSASDNRSEAKDGAATSHSLRTGADYLASLRDGRQVFVEGESVADVTQHKAFREAARSIARLYDIAGDPENRARMTFPSPATGAPAMGVHVTRSGEDSNV